MVEKTQFALGDTVYYIVNQVYAHEFQYNDNSLVNPEDYINIIEINFSSMADS